MAIKFMGKNPHRKVVRQIPNKKSSNRINMFNEQKAEENKIR